MWILRQGKKTPCRRYDGALQYHAPVVKRRIRRKNGGQDLACHVTVQFYTALDIRFKPYLAFDRYESAYFFLGKNKRSLGDLIQRLLLPGEYSELAYPREAAPELVAPLHLLRTGRGPDWDRRVHITAAPAFAIVGEEQQIELRIEDAGQAPGDEMVTLQISIDGDEPTFHEVPIGRGLALPITLTHGGQNVVQFIIPEAEGELTDRNNAAVVSVNGVRDRLRVGDTVTWGCFPASGDPVTAEFRVVEDPLEDLLDTIETRLADQDGLVRSHVRAQVFLNQGLHNAALQEALRIVEEREDSARGWAVMQQALKGMGLEGTGLWGEVRGRLDGRRLHALVSWCASATPHKRVDSTQQDQPVCRCLTVDLEPNEVHAGGDALL